VGVTYDPNLEASVTATAQKVLIPMIRKVMPALIAQQIVGVQPMDADTGSLFGRLTAKGFNTKYWPHQYYVNYLDRREVERWCYDNFKSRNWNSYRNQFVFKRKEDAMLFALRWS
jgi:Major capsid protein Gp23